MKISTQTFYFRAALLLLLTIMPSGAKDLMGLVSEYSDSGFGGYYLRIEETMKELKVSRLKAHEIQNQLRDLLEERSGSFSRISQTPFLEECLEEAVTRVISQKLNEGFFRETKFEKGDFLIVFDLDETLLTHWYDQGKRTGSFQHEIRDTVPVTVDRKTGDSLNTSKMHFSPDRVQLRPGIEELARIVSRSKGFRGFLVFTAKEDRSAWDVYGKWKHIHPFFFSHVVGFYTRNYLRFDGNLSKPSKDLRIFDESLSHVFLIDDNESRVLQKDWNYRIPKFNADAYIESTLKGGNQNVLGLNNDMLPYIARTIGVCSKLALDGEFQSEPAYCLSQTLGVLSSQGDHKEVDLYYQRNQAEFPLERKRLYKVFHQPFHPAYTKELSEEFPRFRNFQMIQ